MYNIVIGLEQSLQKLLGREQSLQKLLGREQSLQRLRNSNSVVWLGGDFSLPNIDWEDNAVKPDTQLVGLGNSLLDICSDMGLTQMNNQPTRKKPSWTSTL